MEKNSLNNGDLLEKYNKFGYIILPNFISHEDCIKILNLDKLQLKEEQQLEYPYSNCRALKICDIDYNPKKITRIIRTLFGKNFDCWYKKLYPKLKFDGSYEPYHQDFWYRKNEGVDCSYYKQAFLSLSNLEFCPLNVFDGSHKMGLVKHEQVLERNGMSKYKVKSSLLQDIEGLVSLNLKVGDLVIFDYFLIHGSCSNFSNQNQPRAVFQYKDNSMKYISSSKEFQQRKEQEIIMLEKMLKNRRGQRILPKGYPGGEINEFKN